MELLLNLTWLAISATLGVLLLASRPGCEVVSGKCAYARSTAWLSYFILIALLLPAISMTDDMMAMVAPADGEQIARRYEVSAGGQRNVDFHVALFCVVPDVSYMRLVCIGVQEVIPSSRAFCLSTRQHTRDRAPPVAA